MTWPNRVVVTGRGVVSPVGKDAATYWAALTEGRSGIAQPTLVPPERLLREVVAEVKDYVPTDYFEERQLAPLDRVTQFAVIAAREALAPHVSAGPTQRFQLLHQIAVDAGIGFEQVLDDGYPGRMRKRLGRQCDLVLRVREKVRFGDAHILLFHCNITMNIPIRQIIFFAI